jgi:hypothetical protein
MKFQFGDGKSYDDYKIIDASNLELAIKLFKLDVLWPERYVSYRVCPKDQRWNKYDKDSPFLHIETDDLPKNLDPQTMKIPVFEIVPVPDDKRGRSRPDKMKWRVDLDVLDCINVDFSSLTPVKYLSAPTTGDGGEDGTAVVEALNQNLVRSFTSKIQVREMVDSVMRKKNEIERLKRQLNEQLQALEDDISRKRKQIAAIETYLGTNEEIVTLIERQPAADAEPIFVYQMKLYMDEEVGLLDDCFSNIGRHNEVYEPKTIDYQNIEEFDAWVSKNYDKFLYKPKSIMAWQVRRYDKKYDKDRIVNSLLNTENKATYFLIRNGTCLYRIYSAVYIPDNIFPTGVEWESFYKETWERRRQEFLESRMFIMIALQGLIDRTAVFGTNLRGKVDLIKPDGFTPDQISLIRDAEKEFYIGDGRPSWNEYVSTNRGTITKGTRVLINCETSYDYKERHKRLRGYNQKYPSPMEIHVVKEVRESKFFSDNYLISYHSDHEIYNRDPYAEEYSHINSRRVPIWLYRSEMLNIDAISFEDINYYLHNRLCRQEYLDILPAMKFAGKVKHDEYVAETPFMKLVMQKTDCKDELTVRRAIAWYKLKNSIKRSIAADDQKAFRMVYKRVLNPTYYDSQCVIRGGRRNIRRMRGDMVKE